MTFYLAMGLIFILILHRENAQNTHGKADEGVRSHPHAFHRSLRSLACPPVIVNTRAILPHGTVHPPVRPQSAEPRCGYRLPLLALHQVDAARHGHLAQWLSWQWRDWYPSSLGETGLAGIPIRTWALEMASRCEGVGVCEFCGGGTR